MSKRDEKGSYRRIEVVVDAEPNCIPKGLKSKFVNSLLTHSIPLFGRVRRERVESGLVINIIIGNPNIKITDWTIIEETLKIIFEPCGIIEINATNIEIPKVGSVFRLSLFVGETTDGAKRTGNSITPSGTTNTAAKQRTEFEKYDSSSVHTLLTGGDDNGDADEIVGDDGNDVYIGESVSQVRQSKSFKLQRAVGSIQIGSHEPLDKRDCTLWPEDAIEQLLVTKMSYGGVGIPEKLLTGITVYGMHLENIIDALISFIGVKEAKIAHTCNELPNAMEDIKKSIVRWVYKHLVEQSK